MLSPTSIRRSYDVPMMSNGGHQNIMILCSSMTLRRLEGKHRKYSNKKKNIKKTLQSLKVRT